MPELQGILAGGMRQFVDKRLDHERQRVAVGRAQRAGADGDRLERSVDPDVGNERMRELRPPVRPEALVACPLPPRPPSDRRS